MQRHEQGFGAADFGPVTIDGLDADVVDGKIKHCLDPRNKHVFYIKYFIYYI